MEVDTPIGRPSFVRKPARFDPLPALSQSLEIDPKKRSYKQQYANVYFIRLTLLKSRTVNRARERWSELEGITEPPALVDRVLDVQQAEPCFIVGTIYMDMPLKPNVLEDIAKEHSVTVPPPRPKICSKDDVIYLEDDSGRIQLVGDLIESREWPLVTGIIVAVLGAETSNGSFQAVDICFPGLPIQSSITPPSPESAPTEDAGDEWVAIASGLEMGGKEDAVDLRTDLFLEWLTGQVGGVEDRQKISRISRVILAGNSMADTSREEDLDAKKPKKYGQASSNYTAKPTLALDLFLCNLLPSIDVDIMPGQKDPTGTTLPQQRLHPALLPNAHKLQGLEFRTNPYWAEIGGATFLGTSGQNLDDIFKYVDGPDRLQMAKDTLEWSHIAPTAPDTLWCYPFSDRDPFLLQRAPHIYFVGNQPEFATGMVEGDDGQRTRVINVPAFSNTGEIAIVNTTTLECRKVSFRM